MIDTVLRLCLFVYKVLNSYLHTHRLLWRKCLRSVWWIWLGVRGCLKLVLSGRGLKRAVSSTSRFTHSHSHTHTLTHTHTSTHIHTHTHTSHTHTHTHTHPHHTQVPLYPWSCYICPGRHSKCIYTYSDYVAIQYLQYN